MAASTPTRTPLGAAMATSPPRALSSCVELEQALLGELVLLAEEHGARRLTPTTFVTAAAGVRRRLEQHAEQVAELEQLASEHDRPADQEEAMRQARRHRAEGDALAASLRELGAKVRAGAAELEAAERAALLLGGADGNGGGGGGEGSAAGRLSARAATQASRDATASLRRTRELMAQELERSDLQLRMLHDQGAELKSTLRDHHGLTGTLSTGRRALSRLQRRDFTDRVLMILGFLFFLLVVLHILKKRLWHPDAPAQIDVAAGVPATASDELLAAAAEEAAAAAAATAAAAAAARERLAEQQRKAREEQAHRDKLMLEQHREKERLERERQERKKQEEQARQEQEEQERKKQEQLRRAEAAREAARARLAAEAASQAQAPPVGEGNNKLEL